MTGQVWDVLVGVSAVIGALTLWAVATGAVVSYFLRNHHSRPATVPVEADSALDHLLGEDEATERPVANRRARSWAEVPAWVKDDREWAAAVVLLGSDSIAARTEPYVDFGARRIDWMNLRFDAANWVASDRLLVEVAYDLAYGDHEVTVDDEQRPHVAVADLTELNGPGFELLQAAINARRGVRA